jgi:hypothetical protein
MNFKAKGKMSSHPSFAAKVNLDPLQFDTSANGTLDFGIGPVSVYIGEIGVRFAIPFLKHRRKLPLVASVGGFHINVRPFRVRSHGLALQLSGILGTQGSSGTIETKVACETDMEVEGKFPVKGGKVQINLCDVADMADDL